MNKRDPNVERALVAAVALLLGAIGTYLSVDMIAVCERLINGS